MKRIDIGEIHEQAWLPALLRDEITDGLQSVFGFLRAYQPVAGPLGRAAHVAGARRFVDLCSGAGGPWLWLQGSIRPSGGGALPVCLTDKYPNLTAFERAKALSNGAIDFYANPVDATHLPAELYGFRTIFSSFHHFPPKQVASILEDAAANRQGIGVFELARRRPKTIALTFLVALAGLLAAPFARPFRVSRIIFTYLIPVVPLVLWIDGTLSCMRAYLPDEMREMASQIKAKDYVWEVGETTEGLIPVTYMIGYPDDASSRMR